MGSEVQMGARVKEPRLKHDEEMKLSVDYSKKELVDQNKCIKMARYCVQRMH